MSPIVNKLGKKCAQSLSKIAQIAKFWSHCYAMLSSIDLSTEILNVKTYFFLILVMVRKASPERLTSTKRQQSTRTRSY